jgi:hypothetical protein
VIHDHGARRGGQYRDGYADDHAHAPVTLSSSDRNLTAPQLTWYADHVHRDGDKRTAPYSYKWWLFDGANWTILQNWSAGNTYTWTPSVANSAFRVAVWVRNAGSTADNYDNPQSNGSVAFPVNLADAADADRSHVEPARTAGGRHADHVHGDGLRWPRAAPVQVVGIRRQVVDRAAELVDEQHVDLDSDIGWWQHARRRVGSQCGQHGRCL